MDRGRWFLALTLVAALGACGLFDKEPPPVRLGPIYSPNGEPLSGGALGDPKCEDAMRHWFARVDADHDGTIDLGEFLADARRQFAVMDLDHSGVLTPAVLAQYRAPFMNDRARRQASNDDEDDDDRRNRRNHIGYDGPAVGLDRADPVMLADVNLRNRVTLDGFLSYAGRNFASLDADKNGRLSGDEIEAVCKPQ